MVVTSDFYILYFLLPIVVVFWYEGYGSLFQENSKQQWYVLTPLLNFFCLVGRLFSNMARGFLLYKNLVQTLFRVPFSWTLYWVLYLILTSNGPQSPSAIKSVTSRSLEVLVVVISYGLISLISVIPTRSVDLVYAAYLFFYRAVLPIYITWLLVYFSYLTLVKFDWSKSPSKPQAWANPLTQLGSVATFLYSRHTPTSSNRTKVWLSIITSCLDMTFFIKRYYYLNNLIWQDGYLIDFIQKKVLDRWTRTFIIYSGYLFSERYLFDSVTRIYIEFIMWPTYTLSIYEFQSAWSTIVLTLVLLVFFIVLFAFLSFYMVTL